MHDAYGRNQVNAYMVQRIENATAEELAAMLLAGAQKFLTQAVDAIHRKDHMEKARMLDRTSKIMNHLLGMLNPEADRSVVNRIHGIYIWWVKEMFEGSRYNRPEQIETVVKQMDDLRRQYSLCSRNAQSQVTILSSTQVLGEMVG